MSEQPSRDGGGATVADGVSSRRGLVRRRVQPTTWIVLTLVWVMLWGDVSFMNVISGFVVSALLLMVFPFPPVDYGIRIRPLASIAMSVRFLADMVAASIEVAYKACAPWEHPQGQLARIELRGNNDLLCTMVAQMTTLVPGSIVVDMEVDGPQRTLLIHIFDARGPQDIEQMRERVLSQEDRVLKALSLRPFRERRVDGAGDETGGSRA